MEIVKLLNLVFYQEVGTQINLNDMKKILILHLLFISLYSKSQELSKRDSIVKYIYNNYTSYNDTKDDVFKIKDSVYCLVIFNKYTIANIDSFKNLKILKIASNKIYLNNNFDDFDSLIYFYFSSYKCKFNDSIKDLKSLISFNGQDANFIKCFPKFLYFSYNLMDITIGIKKFSNFSNDISNLKNLDELVIFCKKNTCTKLNNHLYELSNLKILDIASSKNKSLIIISDSILNLQKLECLELPTKLDNSSLNILIKLPKLKILDVTKIDLEDYSEIQKLSNLSELYISKTNKKELEILKQYLPNTKINNK